MVTKSVAPTSDGESASAKGNPINGIGAKGEKNPCAGIRFDNVV